jgi:hypothetical protein
MTEIHPAYNILNYICDGFQHVADVVCHPNLEWSYSNANLELLFSPHTSWVYFIVRALEIVKCGETEKPLGIRYSREINQPIPNSTCRFGGYRRGVSEWFIRDALKNCTDVSIWARKCDIVEQRVMAAGTEQIMKSYHHKALEKWYLENFFHQSGYIPFLNPITK